MDARVTVLQTELHNRGVLTAREVAGALEVSQPTVSRLIAALGAERVLRIGQGRATRYGLRRSVRGLGSAWPLYTVGPKATVRLEGRLHALEPKGWCVEQDEPWETLRGAEFPAGLYPALPWFLQDLRPQGFLGRTFARRFADQLGTPTDPRHWSDDDVVTALLRRGEDLPGAFIVGESAVALLQARTLSPAATVGPDEYPALADAALAGEWPGSSAAGEQPKFTACVREAAATARPVIVKFSGSTARPEDRRWADLLVAEHAANAVLSAQGIPCAATQVLEAGGRVFLESTRFDRVGAHGRRGLVTLEALDSAFYGRLGTPWPAAAERLRAGRWLAAADAARLALLWWFGTLIGNTDMHYGNVSLFLGPRRPLSLAPVYDMVPMLYRPGPEGRLPDEPLAPRLPPPEALVPWTHAAVLAEEFWVRVGQTDSVSPAFRAIAERNASGVAQMRRRITGGGGDGQDARPTPG
jgi:hypothetical protein